MIDRKVLSEYNPLSLCVSDNLWNLQNIQQ